MRGIGGGGGGVREAKLFNSRAIIVNLLCPTQCNERQGRQSQGSGSGWMVWYGMAWQ